MKRSLIVLLMSLICSTSFAKIKITSGSNDFLKSNSTAVLVFDYSETTWEEDELYKNMILEPAFNEPDFSAVKKQELEKWLFNIFDQDAEHAYRRNRYYWGRRYERKQRIGNSVYSILLKMIPIRDKMKRLLRWKHME